MSIIVSTASLLTTPQAVHKRLRNRNRQEAWCQDSSTNFNGQHSVLSLNVSEIQLSSDSTVTLTWNISESVNPLDWIGEKNPFRYLDYRSHGLCSQPKGSMLWHFSPDLVTALRPRRNAKVCFKYFDGVNGNVRAVSSVVNISIPQAAINNSNNILPTMSGNENGNLSSLPIQDAIINLPTTFRITNIMCVNLRKAFIPSTFVVYVLLHPQGQNLYKTTSQPITDPDWKQLNIEFVCDKKQNILFEVKDKNRPSFQQNIGHALISSEKILDEFHRRNDSWVTLNLPLISKQPKNRTMESNSALLFTVHVSQENGNDDNQICGSLANRTTTTSIVDNGGSMLANIDDEIILSPTDGSTAPNEWNRRSINVMRLGLNESGYTTDSSNSDDRMQISSPSPTGGAQCSRYGTETIRPNNSDSGISQRSNGTSSSGNLATSVVNGSASNGYHLSHSRYPVVGGVRGSGCSKSALMTRSVPQTPVKSPRFRRQDSLNAICAECLTKSGKNMVRASSSKSAQNLSLTLKNSSLVCAKCKTLNASAVTSSKFLSSSNNIIVTSDAYPLDLLLPAFCEARVDAHGRIFYIDHLNKTTSWQRPMEKNRALRYLTEKVRRQQVDCRYKCMRKTVGSALARVDGNFVDHTQWPAVLFLTRQDFMSYLHNSENGKEIYDNSQSVRHIIHRVRKDPTRFDRYQYNKDLVALLNEFADKSQAMPPDWEAKVDPNGKEFFVDHKNKRTTFIDPRLPLSVFNQRRRRARSAPSAADEEEITYNERVVNFLRQPGAMELIQSRLPSNCNQAKLKRKFEAICKIGVPALKKYANDVDLITVLSFCEQEILSDLKPQSDSSSDLGKSKDNGFDSKLADFYLKLCEKGYGQGPNKLKLIIRREYLLKDAFEQVMSVSKRDLQRSKLTINFDDEEGLDYGGPSREFFFLLSRELFNPYYGLFEYSANDTYTVQISPVSIFVENYIDWFKFSGRLLGLALMHRFLIDAFFTRAFYKFLLRMPCLVADLESLDSQFHSSLLWLQDNPVSPDLQLTFSVNEDVAGEIVERMLKAGGDEISVTEENKQEYIERMVKWRLERGVKKQAEALLTGFYEVIDPSLVRVFDARELELVLSGTIEIDIGDWRLNTEYKGGYHDDHVVIFWFWQAIERFSNSQRLLVLQFVTGTSSIPCEGFSALRGSHGPKKFTVEKWGCPSSLPRAHTCFNRLDLPPYPSFKILYDKLLTAIEESSSYGIE